jgi:hypothetical protein
MHDGSWLEKHTSSFLHAMQLKVDITLFIDQFSTVPLNLHQL